MTTICEDRYGRGWVAWSADPEDAPPGFNGGDSEHDAFYRRAHHFPMGWGRTPDAALAALRREVARFQADTDGYTCCLHDQEATWEPAVAARIARSGSTGVEVLSNGLKVTLQDGPAATEPADELDRSMRAVEDWVRQVIPDAHSVRVTWFSNGQHQLEFRSHGSGFEVTLPAEIFDGTPEQAVAIAAARLMPERDTAGP